MACGEFLELAEAPDAGINGTGECPKRDLEGVAGIDQKRIGSCDQLVPVDGIDMDADLPGRVGLGCAEGDDLLFQADFQPLERHNEGIRALQLEVVEPAAEQGAPAQFVDQLAERARIARQRAVDTLMGQ